MFGLWGPSFIRIASVDNILALTRLHLRAIRWELRWSLSLGPEHSFRPPFWRTRCTSSTSDVTICGTIHTVACTTGTATNPETENRNRDAFDYGRRWMYVYSVPCHMWFDCPVGLLQWYSDCTLAHTESFVMRCPADCNRRTEFDWYSSCLIRWEHCSTATSPSTEPFAATNLSFGSDVPYAPPSNRRPSSHLTKSKHLREIGIERRKTKTLVSDGRNVGGIMCRCGNLVLGRFRLRNLHLRPAISVFGCTLRNCPDRWPFLAPFCRCKARSCPGTTHGATIRRASRVEIDWCICILPAHRDDDFPESTSHTVEKQLIMCIESSCEWLWRHDESTHRWYASVNGFVITAKWFEFLQQRFAVDAP